jgi:hypothetical protein
MHENVLFFLNSELELMFILVEHFKINAELNGFISPVFKTDCLITVVCHYIMVYKMDTGMPSCVLTYLNGCQEFFHF